MIELLPENDPVSADTFDDMCKTMSCKRNNYFTNHAKCCNIITELKKDRR